MAFNEEHKNVGRPPKFTDPAAIIEQGDKYFDWIRGEKQTLVNGKGETEEVWVRFPEPATITGLCLFLGFESRQSFHDYCDKSEEFSYALKRLRMRIECIYEQNLHGTTPTGSIFALKNMGWKDQYQNEHTGKNGGPIETKYELTLNIR